MELLITGACGFVGSTIAKCLHETAPEIRIQGLDNLIRPGSELNRTELKRRGIKLHHADLRNQNDISALPGVDYVIDAAANPSVLAGIDGQTSSRQLLDHNLGGTVNLLEYCKSHKAGFILLSTSRVYAIEPLAQLPVKVEDRAFEPDTAGLLPPNVSSKGVTEAFSTKPPLSLYGSSKLASEILALEYGACFGFPAWINRCGVLAGAGQFGRPDQGIFSFWINAYLRRKPLKYIGFGGSGYQTRDCLHPSDLVPLILKQMSKSSHAEQAGLPQIINAGGGQKNAMSLAQLSDWCARRFGSHEIGVDRKPRPFDIPWMLMDSTLAGETWGWEPQTPIEDILTEIAGHAEKHPDWLETSLP